MSAVSFFLSLSLFFDSNLEMLPCLVQVRNIGGAKGVRGRHRGCCVRKYFIYTHKKRVTFSSLNFMKLINSPRHMFKSLELNFSHIGH